MPARSAAVRWTRSRCAGPRSVDAANNAAYGPETIREPVDMPSAPRVTVDARAAAIAVSDRAAETRGRASASSHPPCGIGRFPAYGLTTVLPTPCGDRRTELQSPCVAHAVESWFPGLAGVRLAEMMEAKDGAGHVAYRVLGDLRFAGPCGG